MIDSAKETSNKYQIGDSVIINSQEWIIAKEFNGNVFYFGIVSMNTAVQ